MEGKKITLMPNLTVSLAHAKSYENYNNIYTCLKCKEGVLMKNRRSSIGI